MTITEALNNPVNGLRDEIADRMGVCAATLSNWLQVHNRRSNFDIDRLPAFFRIADEVSLERRGRPAMDGARLFIISSLSPAAKVKLNNDVSDELHRIIAAIGRMGEILDQTGGGNLNQMHPEIR